MHLALQVKLTLSMASVVMSLSLLLVAFLLTEPSFGKPLNGTRQDNTFSDTMVFDMEEDSDNEQQLMDKILSHLNAEAQRTKITIDKRLSRKRKSIFGVDNRINIGTSGQAQMYPYSTVVTLSSGCTGTLIGAQHVLTAAHCVHDGKRFVKHARKLKIGILLGNGKFQWIRVRKIHLPRQWIKTTTNDRIKYDYTVLRLKRPHGRPIMAIKASNLKRGDSMRFAGFHSDKTSNTMWYSQCRVMEVVHDAVFSYCDGQRGISGSGVRSDNAVVGVVSAIGRGRLRGKRHVFNVVITLTPRKVRRILKWMKKRTSRRRLRARRRKAKQ